MHWVRVTKADPCPICKKPDWCTLSEDLCLCMRQESSRPSKGNAGGWLHSLGDPQRVYRPVQAPPTPRPVTIDAEAIMRGFESETWPEMIAQLAGSLGVTARSLEAIGTAWAQSHNAFAFPMRDWTGKIIGIRLRDHTGHKWAIRGSRAGLFYSEASKAPEVAIVEGPTDLAAAITIGIPTIGRPSCQGSEQDIVRLLARWDVRSVVVITDNDGPGWAGAQRLSGMLTVPHVCWTPPTKDLRAYVRAGGNRALIHAMTRSLVWTKPVNHDRRDRP